MEIGSMPQRIKFTSYTALGLIPTTCMSGRFGDPSPTLLLRKYVFSIQFTSVWRNCWFSSSFHGPPPMLDLLNISAVSVFCFMFSLPDTSEFCSIFGDHFDCILHTPVSIFLFGWTGHLNLCLQVFFMQKVAESTAKSEIGSYTSACVKQHC